MATNKEALIEKILRLPPEKLASVEDFVDFLAAWDEDRRLSQSAARMSEAAFARVWDNPEDAAYDAL